MERKTDYETDKEKIKERWRSTLGKPHQAIEEKWHDLRHRSRDERTAEAEKVMKLDGPDELSAILDDICASIGELLVTYAQLKEGMVDDAATTQAASNLERLRKETLLAKEKLADLKQRQRHRNEMERQRREHERQSAKPKQTEGKDS